MIGENQQLDSTQSYYHYLSSSDGEKNMDKCMEIKIASGRFQAQLRLSNFFIAIFFLSFQLCRFINCSEINL